MIDSVTVFEYEMTDFGTVKEGEPVYGQFAFANYAGQALEIELVSTCECIIAEWSQGPIQHNQKGEIIYKFDTKGEGPDVLKTVDIIFKNTDEHGYPLVKQLFIKGKIKK